MDRWRLPPICRTLPLVALALGAIVCRPVVAQQAPGADSAQSKTPKKDLPLETTRTIRLDTDEGSWISLDVSPDGATLVFDLLGDL